MRKKRKISELDTIVGELIPLSQIQRKPIKRKKKYKKVGKKKALDKPPKARARKKIQKNPYLLPEEPPPPPTVPVYAHSREFAIRLAKNLQWDKYIAKGYYEKHKEKMARKAERWRPKKVQKRLFKRDPKYNNKRCIYEGITFDSIREKDRYIYLKYLQRQGVIRDLECQPKYILESPERGPILLKSETRKTKLTYTPDFRYRLALTDELVVEDVKSAATFDEYAFKVKRALWEWLFDMELKVVIDIRLAPGKTSV